MIKFVLFSFITWNGVPTQIHIEHEMIFKDLQACEAFGEYTTKVVHDVTVSCHPMLFAE